MSKRVTIARPIDNHPRREEIVKDLMNPNKTTKSIAEKYGLNRNTTTAARKRMQYVMVETVAATMDDKTLARAVSRSEHAADILSIDAIASGLNALMVHADAIRTSGGKPQLALQAIREHRELYNSLIKIGEIAERHQARDGTKSHEYQRLQRAVAMLLRAHPDLRGEFRAYYRARKAETEGVPLDLGEGEEDAPRA